MNHDKGTYITGIPGPTRGEVRMHDGAVIQISAELLDDARIMATVIGDAFDRWRTPWEFPDHPTWPTIIPLPRLQQAVTTIQERRERVRDAWAVLLGRESIHTWEDDE